MKNNDRNDIMVRNNGGEFDLFDNLFDDFFRMPSFARNEFRQFDRVMKTDIKENENNYELEIEMPGFEKNDVNLSIDNGYLTIEASKNTSNDEKNSKGEYIRRERKSGSFSRSFYVGDIKEDSIIAKLEKGLLTVEIPKAKPEIQNKKRIEIK